MSGSPLSREDLAALAQAIDARIGVMKSDLRQGLHRAEGPEVLRLVNHLEETDDAPVADLLLATEIAEIQRDAAELKQLQLARRRLQEGTYGECVDCGTWIPLQRLRAQPAAARCVSCQETVEKRAVGGGAPAPHSL
jgi:RNA polymerase-binding transcription factor DksA